MDIRVTGEVIKVFEVEAGLPSEGGYDSLRFRVELIADYKDPDRLTARIWRKEFY